MRRAPEIVVTLAAFAAVVLSSSARAADPPLGFRPIPLRVTAIERFEFGRDRTRFGELEFLGGLELESRDGDFGGFSGLDFGPLSGALVAVSDTGAWLRMRPIETGGRLVGVADVAIAPMRDKTGRAVRRKNEGDAEALRFWQHEGAVAALVVIEEFNELRAFTADGELALAIPTLEPLPDAVAHLRSDKGVEGLAVAPPDSPLAGARVLFSEGPLGSNGNRQGWIIEGPLTGSFELRSTDRFDLTDAAFLANGDLMVLERRFSLGEGFAMRLCLVQGADIRPAAAVDCRPLMTADMRYQIDNMEGLAVRESADGVEIYLIADDNHSVFERTLLLKFAWRPSNSPSALK